MGDGFAGFGVFIGSDDGVASGFDSNSKSAILIVKSIFESRVATNGGATLSICSSSLGNGGGGGGGVSSWISRGGGGGGAISGTVSIVLIVRSGIRFASKSRIIMRNESNNITKKTPPTSLPMRPLSKIIGFLFLISCILYLKSFYQLPFNVETKTLTAPANLASSKTSTVF